MFYHESFVSLFGFELFVRKIYPDKGAKSTLPVIFFLHEGLGSIDQWKDFPEKLVEATGFPAIVYDRQGYGKSSPLTEKRGLDYIHKEEIILQQLINKLQVESYFIVGHSEGGSLALIHASRHPSGLRKVVSLSANTINEPKITPSIQHVMETYKKPGSRLKQSLLKYHGEKTDAVFYAWSKTWTASFFSSWNILNELKQIKTPLLAFHGADDQYTSLDQIKNIQELIPAPKEIHILAQCSHHPHFDHEEIVVETIGHFLRD